MATGYSSLTNVELSSMSTYKNRYEKYARLAPIALVCLTVCSSYAGEEIGEYVLFYNREGIEKQDRDFGLPEFFLDNRETPMASYYVYQRAEDPLESRGNYHLLTLSQADDLNDLADRMLDPRDYLDNTPMEFTDHRSNSFEYDFCWSPKKNTPWFIVRSSHQGRSHLYKGKKSVISAKTYFKGETAGRHPDIGTDGKTVYSQDGELFEDGKALDVPIPGTKWNPHYRPGDPKTIAIEVQLANRGGERRIFIWEGRKELKEIGADLPPCDTSIVFGNVNPTWSDDGRYLAFYSNSEMSSSVSYRLYAYDFKAGKLQLIDPAPVQALELNYRGYSSIRWLHGKWEHSLIYIRLTNNPGEFQPIFICDVTGGSPRQVNAAESVRSWSLPDQGYRNSTIKRYSVDIQKAQKSGDTQKAQEYEAKSKLLEEKGIFWEPSIKVYSNVNLAISGDNRFMLMTSRYYFGYLGQHDVVLLAPMKGF
ncbi:hypothetical protein CEE37_14475 [candidate division LCP-89 bacterium B3_LCP]|uniref:Dipeptidylpeptidase IV N-terminal domain-containing protein n=1 Tax=candidate division LCP-89 bacterium B3_LCP TaxID=2012998 RepID=A0A532UQ42_UNCL8|nr:MAG: hypothetical protein CEE37_14475 [candidate division LCP-89 bacterium B3_LCP]